MKPVTPRFPKGSLAYEAHKTYLQHVGRAFIYHIGPTFIQNRGLFQDMFNGVLGLLKFILLLIIMILSPLFCWFSGYRNMKEFRERFEQGGGTYAGKFSHLNDKDT